MKPTYIVNMVWLCIAMTSMVIMAYVTWRSHVHSKRHRQLQERMEKEYHAKNMELMNIRIEREKGRDPWE